MITANYMLIFMFHTSNDPLICRYRTCCAITSGTQNIPFSRWGNYAHFRPATIQSISNIVQASIPFEKLSQLKYKAANEVSTQWPKQWLFGSFLSVHSASCWEGQYEYMLWCIEEQQTRLGDAIESFVVGSMGPIPKRKLTYSWHHLS